MRPSATVAGDPRACSRSSRTCSPTRSSSRPRGGQVTRHRSSRRRAARIKVSDTGMRDRSRVPAARLQSLFAGGQLEHAHVRRPRSGPGDRAPPRRAARRNRPGRERRERQGRHLLGDAARSWQRCRDGARACERAVPDGTAARRGAERPSPAPAEDCASWSWTTIWRRGRRSPRCSRSTGAEVRVAESADAGDEPRSRSSGPRCSCATSPCPARMATLHSQVRALGADAAAAASPRSRSPRWPAKTIASARSRRGFRCT